MATGKNYSLACLDLLIRSSLWPAQCFSPSGHGQKQPTDQPTMQTQQCRAGSNAFWLKRILVEKLIVCSICSVLNAVKD